MAPNPRIVRPLLRWYDRNRRALPWRDARDPYRVWVSEVMLQQTRVEVVRRFFEPFVARFPTVETLAGATEADVLLAWAGLGYYSRARNLHRAANLLCERHGGRLPRTVASLMGLPGIGRYSAGAIASIAWGARVPAVDGNVTRILVRLACISADPRSARVAARLWSIAERLVPADRPGDFNQALMELGASICTPVSPGCGACPIARACRARHAGSVSVLPATRAGKERPEILAVCGAIALGKRILFVRRRPAGLLGGLWELPGAEVPRVTRAGLRRALRERVGLDVRVGQRAGTVRHTFTHRALTLAVFECSEARGAVRLGDDYVEHEWMEPARAPSRLALPALTCKVLAIIDSQG